MFVWSRLDCDAVQHILTFLSGPLLLCLSTVSKSIRYAVKDSIQNRRCRSPEPRELFLVKLVNASLYGTSPSPGRNAICAERLVFPTQSLGRRMKSLHFLFEYPCLNKLEIQLKQQDIELLDHVLKTRSTTTTVGQQMEVVVECRDMRGICESFALDIMQSWLRLFEVLAPFSDCISRVTLRSHPVSLVRCLMSVLDWAHGNVYKTLVRSLFHVEDVTNWRATAISAVQWQQLSTTVQSVQSVVTCLSESADIRSLLSLCASTNSDLSIMHVDRMNCMSLVANGTYSFQIPTRLFSLSCPVRRRLSEFVKTSFGSKISCFRRVSSTGVLKVEPTLDSIASEAVCDILVATQRTHLLRAPSNSFVALEMPSYALQMLSSDKYESSQLVALADRNVRVLHMSFTSDYINNVEEDIASKLCFLHDAGLLCDAGFFVELTSHLFPRKVLVDDVKRRAFTCTLTALVTSRMSTRSGRFFITSDCRIDQFSYLFFARFYRHDSPMIMEDD